MYVGSHESIYQAEQNQDEIVFAKSRQTKAMKHADHEQTRVGILLHVVMCCAK